jgi:hypothetical protein
MKQAKVSVRAGRACFYLRKPYLAYCTPMYMEAETVSPFVPGDLPGACCVTIARGIKETPPSP